jgi:hypothetical protein
MNKKYGGHMFELLDVASIAANVASFAFVAYKIRQNSKSKYNSELSSNMLN